MGSTREASELSLEDLEALLAAKRRYLTEGKVRRFVAAQNVLTRETPLRTQDDRVMSKPVHSPETWRGAEGQDRYFRSLVMSPIDAAGPRGRPFSRAGGDAARVGAIGDRRLIMAANSAQAPPDQKTRRGRNAFLLAFEFVTLIGFLIILGSSYTRLQALNRQVREAYQVEPSQAIQHPATIAATVTPVMLLPGGNRPQEVSAVPTNLGGLVKSSVSMVRPPTPGPGTARRMLIPKIGVDAPVVAGDTWEDLKKGIGHRPGGANPGERGNMVVSAHNDTYGEIFRDLDKLEPGDEVLVYTDEGAFRYIVNEVKIVSPTKVEVMDPTDYATLTMITCYPYLVDTHRVVAIADLAD